MAAALAFRGVAGWTQNLAGWRQDLVRATELMDSIDPVSRATVIVYKYVGIPRGVLAADDAALAEIEEALCVAELTSDDIAVVLVRMAYGLTLVHHSVAKRAQGYEVLAQLRNICVANRFGINIVPLLDAYAARRSAESGNPDTAIGRLRAAVELMTVTGNIGNVDVAVSLLVETLLERGTEQDLADAEAAIDGLLHPAFDQVFASRDIIVTRLRTLLARTRGDLESYRELKDRYRSMAMSMGFDGQRRWAEALPDD